MRRDEKLIKRRLKLEKNQCVIFVDEPSIMIVVKKKVKRSRNILNGKENGFLNNEIVARDNELVKDIEHFNNYHRLVDKYTGRRRDVVDERCS